MKIPVLILGYGEMGHAMERLLGARHDIRIWDMGMVVKGRHASLEQEVAEAQVILFCLPVNPHREIACRIATHLASGCLCLTIAKGLDESGQTAARIFEDVFGDRHHYGVLYGPMISEELRAGKHGFGDAALSDSADFATIQSLFLGSRLVCQQASDMHGRSWSVILKNVYAIMFGVSDELGLGKNMRGHLMVDRDCRVVGYRADVGREGAHTRRLCRSGRPGDDRHQRRFASPYAGQATGARRLVRHLRRGGAYPAHGREIPLVRMARLSAVLAGP